MKITIYQINPEKDQNQFMFENYERTKLIQGIDIISKDIYDKVFEGEVNCNNLEEAYSMFNSINMPIGYKGRSMSVSDIIEIGCSTEQNKSGLENGFYFCDSIGFRKIKFDSISKK